MRIATRFSIAVHILAILGMELSSEPTSEYMAGSIGVNPVVVRNIIGMLKRAKLVRTSQGVKGAQLAKPLDRVSLLDVYKAVQCDEELFAIHRNPNPECPAGAQIQATLEGICLKAQNALEKELGTVSVEELVRRLKTKKRSSF